MADGEKKKTSAFKKIFVRRGNVQKPDDKGTQGKQRDSGGMDLDLWESETTQLELGSPSASKYPPASDKRGGGSENASCCSGFIARHAV